MSTRSVVIIKNKDKEVWLYHHYDGYPEGVGMDLMYRSNSNKFTNNWVETDIANLLIKDKDECYEITNSYHKDIEYLYIVDCEDKQIKCFKVGDKSWKTYRDLINIDNKIDLDKIFKKKYVTFKLVCPDCKSECKYIRNKSHNWYECTKCGLQFKTGVIVKED